MTAKTPEAFPPRIKHDFVNHKTLIPMTINEAVAEAHGINAQKKLGVVEYLSLAEHAHLLRAAVAEARASAFRDAKLWIAQVRDDYAGSGRASEKVIAFEYAHDYCERMEKLCADSAPPSAAANEGGE